MAAIKRSSARFISYDLRPAKQSERSIMVDILKLAGDCQLPIRNYRYIGLGTNRFYDFMLIHKYLGLQEMVSLERDPGMFERASFNVPFNFIDVVNETIADFISRDTRKKSEILWIDYDDGMNSEIVSDINSIAARMQLGDICFITVAGLPAKGLANKSDKDRLAFLNDELGDYANKVKLEDVENSTFYLAVQKIISTCFENSFSSKLGGKYVPLLQVEYSDSMPMVTVGGAFVTNDKAAALREKIAASLPFLSSNDKEIYRIESFNLTDKERALFDRAVTTNRKNSKERNSLIKLGFGEQKIQSYKELIRYIPRYVETAL